MSKADGSVIIDTRLDTTGLSKGVGNLKSQFGGLGAITKKLGGVIAAAFSVKVINDFSKEAIKLGSDLQEVQNVVDVTFTTMNGQVNKFAKNAMQTAGLSETMAKRYSGTFGAMAKSFKFSEEEAYAMATSLTQLSGDVASFYNLTQDVAYTKLKSVFTGETETLKDLGVVMTQTALDDFALRKGLSKTTSQMSEQEKVALRYQFVMEQLSGASGDFVRTQDSWANQTRILSLQFEQLKATIGMGLINVLTPVLKVINELIGKVQVLAEKFRDVTTAIFGDAGGSAEGVADKYAAAAQGAEDLAENTEKAGKAAKKALAGFDELNILSNDKKESAGTTGSIAGISTNVSIGEVTITDDATNGLVMAVDKVIAKIKELIQPLTKINLTPAKKAFDKLGESLKNLSEIIAGGLEWAWYEILVPLSEWTIEETVPAVVGLLADAFNLLSEYLDPVIDGFEGLKDDCEPIIEWFGTAGKDYIGTFRELFQKLGDTVSEKGPEIRQIFKNISDAVMVMWKIVEPVLNNFKEGWTSLFGSLGTIASEELAATIEIISGITGIIAGALTLDFPRILNGLIDLLNGLIHKIFNGINAIIRGLNMLQFTVPDWIPVIGGKSIGFNFSEITPPKIPYLAKGAVIPPNAPFMAVLGDQRHGTNIEAPLSTIQEAVSKVMADYEASNLAGHEATVEVLRQLLSAVLSIEVGDTVIGQAANRFNRRMAVTTGGV